MPTNPPPVAAAPLVSPAAGGVLSWIDDPGAGNSPDGGSVLLRPIPRTEIGPFPSIIVTPAAPPPDQYPIGSAGFRFWVASEALRRVADFWGTILPATTPWHSTVGSPLPVLLDAGSELNAYYDRSGLKFFHKNIAGRTVFSGESPDVVCHEFGHAVLDAIRPQLWDVTAFEVGAFHESFGDMSAILAALQLPEMRAAVLTETDGKLAHSSRLSRLAEQLGWAIRQARPDDTDADCLRNAVNSFSYVSPSHVPMDAPASMLSREVHSFSRVFTGAFFEALAGMFAILPQTEAGLQTASADMARYLVQAVTAAPVVSSYFAQVGAHLVKAAATDNDDYAEAINSAMLRRGVLSVKGAVAIAKEPSGMAMFAAAAVPRPLELPTREIDVSAFGLTVSTIKVHCAVETPRFDVKGMASFGDPGVAAAGDVEAEATSFLEDLIALGHLNAGTFAARPRGIAAQARTLETHYLEKVGDDVVLRRALFACGCR
jgi:hypothetical protein